MLDTNTGKAVTRLWLLYMICLGALLGCQEVVRPIRVKTCRIIPCLTRLLNGFPYAQQTHKTLLQLVNLNLNVLRTIVQLAQEAGSSLRFSYKCLAS